MKKNGFYLSEKRVADLPMKNLSGYLGIHL